MSEREYEPDTSSEGYHWWVEPSPRPHRGHIPAALFASLDGGEHEPAYGCRTYPTREAALAALAAARATAGGGADVAAELLSCDEVRRLVGDLPMTDEECADLAASANADRHEGVDWLPRYKLALVLLAQSLGILDGVCSKLASVWAGKPEGTTIANLRSEANSLWLAHLRVVGPREKAAQ